MARKTRGRSAKQTAAAPTPDPEPAEEAKPASRATRGGKSKAAAPDPPQPPAPPPAAAVSSRRASARNQRRSPATQSEAESTKSSQETISELPVGEEETSLRSSKRQQSRKRKASELHDHESTEESPDQISQHLLRAGRRRRRGSGDSKQDESSTATAPELSDQLDDEQSQTPKPTSHQQEEEEEEHEGEEEEHEGDAVDKQGMEEVTEEDAQDSSSSPRLLARTMNESEAAQLVSDVLNSYSKRNSSNSLNGAGSAHESPAVEDEQAHGEGENNASGSALTMDDDSTSLPPSSASHHSGPKAHTETADKAAPAPEQTTAYKFDNPLDFLAHSAVAAMSAIPMYAPRGSETGDGNEDGKEELGNLSNDAERKETNTSDEGIETLAVAPASEAEPGGKSERPSSPDEKNIITQDAEDEIDASLDIGGEKDIAGIPSSVNAETTEKSWKPSSPLAEDISDNADSGTTIPQSTPNDSPSQKKSPTGNAGTATDSTMIGTVVMCTEQSADDHDRPKSVPPTTDPLLPEEGGQTDTANLSVELAGDAASVTAVGESTVEADGPPSQSGSLTNEESGVVALDAVPSPETPVENDDVEVLSTEPPENSSPDGSPPEEGEGLSRARDVSPHGGKLSTELVGQLENDKQSDNGVAPMEVDTMDDESDSQNNEEGVAVSAALGLLIQDGTGQKSLQGLVELTENSEGREVTNDDANMTESNVVLDDTCNSFNDASTADGRDANSSEQPEQLLPTSMTPSADLRTAQDGEVYVSVEKDESPVPDNSHKETELNACDISAPMKSDELEAVDGAASNLTSAEHRTESASLLSQDMSAPEAATDKRMDSQLEGEMEVDTSSSPAHEKPCIAATIATADLEETVHASPDVDNDMEMEIEVDEGTAKETDVKIALTMTTIDTAGHSDDKMIYDTDIEADAVTKPATAVTQSPIGDSYEAVPVLEYFDNPVFPSVIPVDLSVGAELLPPRTFRILNLDRVKLKLYNEGRHSHKSRNYARMFAEYWSVISMRLGDDLSASMTRRCAVILDEFLNTKKLRRIHNKLVMGLMNRCLRPYAFVTDVNDRLPGAWKERVSTTTLQAIHGKEKHPVIPTPSAEVENVNVSYDIRVPFRAKDVPFPFQHSDTPMIVESDTGVAAAIQRPISGSSSIPGALAIDPYIRALCAVSGMKVSEHAVWLLVIAMKQFASTCVEHAIHSSKLLDQMKATHTPSSVLGTPGVSSSYANKGEKSSLSAFVFHSLTTTMPQGFARSAGGCMSRAAFESSLSSCMNESTGQTSTDFDSVKGFITKKLSVFTPAKEKVRPPVSPTALAYPVSTERSVSATPVAQEKEGPLKSHPVIAAPAAMERRVSATPGGLGRGAKDLASLKARATRPEASRASPVVAGPVGPTRLDTPSQSAAATDSSEKMTPSSEDMSDSLQQSARRGKGFGIKNLAAMRARSVTSTASPEGNATKVAAALVAAEEEAEAEADEGEAGEAGGKRASRVEVVGEKSASAEEITIPAGRVQVEKGREDPSNAKA